MSRSPVSTRLPGASSFRYLMEAVAEHELSVVLSSHLVADLERVCDYLIVLAASRVQVTGEVEELLATHHRLTGALRDPTSLPSDQQVIESSHTDRQSTLLVRSDGPIRDPAWTVDQVDLEDLVLGLHGPGGRSGARPPVRAGGLSMIRLTWRQFRTQALVALGALVFVAVVSAITGPHLVHLYETTVATCARYGDCSAATTAFLRNDSSLRTWLDIGVIVVPGIIGIFWGAPLVARELEAGTYRLAWTQSVTRTRWLAVKLGVIGLASMATAGLLSLMLTWWASPLDRASMNLFGSFDQRDIVPVGYAAFAFALGVTTGVLIRRPLPAMVVTLVALLTARLAFIHWIRPHLIAPMIRAFALNPTSTGFGSSGFLLFGSGPATLQPASPDIPNAWITSTQIVDRAGHALTTQVLNSDCPGIGGSGPAGGGHTHVPAAAQQALHDCVAKVGATYHEVVTYQPANRYWAFQWFELAIFLVLAFILAGCCLWWIGHRLR